MEIVDGHSHLYQTFAPVGQLKQHVTDIPGFDIDYLVHWLDRMGVAIVQTMPQEMARIRAEWLGSNALSGDLQRSDPDRLVAFAAGEPLDREDVFNRVRLAEVEKAMTEDGLQGLLLTPPYGHYCANDRRVYPFYQKALDLDVPIYFHHSHMFGPPRYCPLKYARITLLDDVIIDFPDLRFNVEHMGYPWTEELLAIMSRSPNVYTDIAAFVGMAGGTGRRMLLARNLGMAREYGVLDRVFYGSDYVGESVDEYVRLLQQELAYIQDELSQDMTRLGFPSLTPEELAGLLASNVRALWSR